MSTFLSKINADIVGAWASGLCAIHCALTPLVFIAQASVHFGTQVAGHSEIPWYWLLIDYAFLLIAFWAIWHTTRQNPKSWIKWGMWSAWSLVALTILAETFHFHFVGHALMYIGAIALVGLHLYNHLSGRTYE
ncbi:MAG: MerC domain-containing protein [Chitinophagales bacterium]|nr:MerC domain-containing protein [Chitinophagales bacterium]